MKFDKCDFFGYSVRLSQLSAEDGGGWLASIPELDGCLADGDTPDEAYEDLKEVLDFWLEVAKEEGKKIPKPLIHEEVLYSGKTIVRMPRNLHRILSEQASIEGVSLNQYMVSLLSYNAGRYEHVSSREVAPVVNLQQYIYYAQEERRVGEANHQQSQKKFDVGPWGGRVGHEIQRRQ